MNDMPVQTSAATQSSSKKVQLRACRATVILLVFLGTQIIFGIFTGIAGIIISVFQGNDLNDTKQFAAMTQSIVAPAAIIGLVASGLATFLMSKLMIEGHLKDNSPTGAAWTLGSSRRIAQGLGVGLFAGLCYLAVSIMFSPQDADLTLGPVAKMAITPGLSQLLWLMIAIVFAPPIEELLFRGVLFGGYCKSFGTVWAAVLTTVIFVTLHITEMYHFLPSIFGITGMAIAALWLRLKSSAVGPAIAVHWGYNAILAIVAMHSTLDK
ncbi:MAG: CPBP family intramembrane glutamic endopeptidase [Nitrospirota bacterium]